MEIQFGESGGHGGWLIGSKLFRPKVYPACASSIRNINLQSLKLCELIFKKSKCHNWTDVCDWLGCVDKIGWIFLSFRKSLAFTSNLFPSDLSQARPTVYNGHGLNAEQLQWIGGNMSYNLGNCFSILGSQVPCERRFRFLGSAIWLLCWSTVFSRQYTQRGPWITP